MPPGPRRPEDEEAAEDDSPEADPVAFRSGVRAKAPAHDICILLVDDDLPTQRALADEAEATAGVRVIAAKSGRDVLAMLSSERVDAVACTFPSRALASGELVRTLRAQRMPVVLLTSDVRRTIAEFGFSVPFLLKPVALGALLAEVRAIWARS
jgi:DNA-binding response OmpR family regulator